MSLQALVGALLVRPHQTRIAGHVGGKDGGEATGRGHGSAGPLFQGSVRLTIQPFAHHDMPPTSRFEPPSFRSALPGQVRIDARGRVVARSPVSDDGWSTRGTFTGAAEAFMAAKRAGVGLKPDPEEPPPAPPIPPPPIIRAEPRLEPPRRGCSPISPLPWRGSRASFDEAN